MNYKMTRRNFMAAAAATAGDSLLPAALAAAEIETPADKAVKALYDSLTEAQRKIMCFEWDKKGYGKYPLRLHVTNNWAVSPVAVRSFTKDQQALIGAIFDSVMEEGWTDKLHKQTKDDTGKPWTRIRAGNATDVLLAAGSAGAGGNLQILYAAFRGEGVFYTTSAPTGLSLSIRSGGQGLQIRL